MQDSTVVARSTDVVGAELEGSIVLLQIKTGTYLELNGTGTHAWQSMQEPQRFSSLIESCLRDFEVDEATCRREMASFLQGLATNKFIRVESSAEVQIGA